MAHSATQVNRNKMELAYGNKVIATFMDEYSIKMFEESPSSYFETFTYHSSWDSIMTVVKKIKSIVYDENYNAFSNAHLSYAKIGNNLYDCDLHSTWASVVWWINCNYHSVNDTGDVTVYENLNKTYFENLTGSQADERAKKYHFLRSFHSEMHSNR